MCETLKVEALAVRDLGQAEHALWSAWVKADRAYASPFFHPDYALAAGEIAPHAGVGVAHRGGRIEAFLPFQRRGRLLQPLAAPMTDYHGPIVRPDAQPNLAAIVGGLGADRFRFNGLKGAGRVGASERAAMVADVSQGFDRYLAPRLAQHGKFFKDKQRAHRSLVRDHGPVEFSLTAGDSGLLDWIIERKRVQYRRTGRHDIFACGWTERLLRRLVEDRGTGVETRFAVLRAGDRIVTAELALTGLGAYHMWFPVYEPEFARYSPGMLLSLMTVQGAADEGFTSVDFGLEGEAYKPYFADPIEILRAGEVSAPSPDGLYARLAASAVRIGPIASARQKLSGRLDVMSACETTSRGWLQGAGSAFRAVAARTRERLEQALWLVTTFLPATAAVI